MDLAVDLAMHHSVYLVLSLALNLNIDSVFGCDEGLELEFGRRFGHC